ncbi:MAG: polysaccharide deacetylase family protein [Deltaproteobacteria bacterium]|nr:polysaccharide deacetylase family protein [Nannocystaceae bacterium]
MGLRSIAAAGLAATLAVTGLTRCIATAEPMRVSQGLQSLEMPVPRGPATPVEPVLAAQVPPAALELPELPEPEPGGRVVYAGPSAPDMVALTFDDGPSPTLTPRVLEVLRLHHARATFFVLGDAAERHPEALRKIVLAGHELGNHGFSHRSFRSLFPSEIAAELDRTADAIASVGGARPTLVRPPFGRFPESSVALLAGRGEDLVLWTVDGGDSDHADAERIAEAVVRAATPGAIVLLHDREPDTLYALPAILSGLARKGLRVVTVSELLARPGT